MKINYFAKARILFSASVVCALLSCSNETDEIGVMANEADQYSAEILEKIAYGCDSYLYDEDVDEKIETSASDEYMALITERLSNIRANKSFANYSTDAYVGVIKTDKKLGCGKYDEIEIRYDCENGHSNNTHSSGYKGLWDVRQNITMRFCLVHNGCFGNTYNSYGVINFYKNEKSPNWEPRSNVSMLEVHMDAEDHHDERTVMKYIDKQKNTIEEKKDFGTVHIDKNGNLNFELIVYLGDGSHYGSFPDLGFEYGVFGTIFNEFEKDYGDYYGHVHSDDEDNNNANTICIKGGKSIKNLTPSYEGVIHMGRNTDFYLTKVM
ncbi:MAG: hypothetical protein MJZ13_06620 [Bacteroidales bacterium]|nr:hypothetical protein [Bacteroidales bacterium]